MQLFAPLVLLVFSSTALAAPKQISNQLGMEFVEIPSGTFTMGTTDVDEALIEIPEPKPGDVLDETPAHPVTISKAFWLGKTEVTQKQWLAVMENRPGPSVNWEHKEWESLPAVSISWFMAKRFVDELSKMDSEYNYRLPTEAEWEYAARAGSSELRPVPIDELTDYAWFIESSGDVSHPVATRKANAFGLHDMFGNAWEWVDDWYGPKTYTADARVDPKGPAEGQSKVRRGGSFHCPLHLTRAGYRAANKPGTGYEVLGFRVVAEKK